VFSAPSTKLPDAFCSFSRLLVGNLLLVLNLWRPRIDGRNLTYTYRVESCRVWLVGKKKPRASSLRIVECVDAVGSKQLQARKTLA
jgi:hypothetical protein